MRYDHILFVEVFKRMPATKCMSKNVNLLTKKQFEIHAKKDHLRLYHTDLVPTLFMYNCKTSLHGGLVIKSTTVMIAN